MRRGPDHTTWVFALALAITFALWFATERTLSIHAIFATRREVFYWLAILLTFALGTAAGDLVSEQFGFGYLATGILLTRPLGASVGDLLSQPGDYGGFGLRRW